ncbi:MAG: hypothetical protein EU517_01645 [Promethearchaeota archaeon]|nr:MAG: hypothetical protein EU517_01645 [Candidatus Lokiarchaeota archaeon]
MINFRDTMLSERIRCAICHADINASDQIFQSKVNYGVICKNCIARFDEEEIEIAINLFALYGGYFGQFKRDGFSFLDRLLELVEMKNEELNLETTNMKLLHFALIHGVTPGELNRSLERFLKE